MIERDRGVCVLCGRPGSQVHHIVPRGWGKRAWLWDMRNLACVCPRCHEGAHNPGIRRVLMERLGALYGYDYGAAPWSGVLK